jgi:hypothetical protein
VAPLVAEASLLGLHRARGAARGTRCEGGETCRRQNNLTRLEAHAIAARSCGPLDRASSAMREKLALCCGPAERHETWRGSTAGIARGLCGSFHVCH